MFFLHLIKFFNLSKQSPRHKYIPNVWRIYRISYEVFIVGNDLIYEYNPNIPDVQIKNFVDEITHIDGYCIYKNHNIRIISIKSNQTHFATTNES